MDISLNCPPNRWASSPPGPVKLGLGCTVSLAFGKVRDKTSLLFQLAFLCVLEGKHLFRVVSAGHSSVECLFM